MRARLASVLLLFGLLSAPPASVAAAASSYAPLAALEARVATIGFRLTTGNAAWCPIQQPQFGWLWGDARLYARADRAAANTAYGAPDTDTAYVAAIARQSPAAIAGMHVGTPVAAVNGVPVSVAANDDPFARIATLERLFAALPLHGTAQIADADGRSFSITPVAGCASDIRVEARDRPTGAADGRLVLISSGLAAFAANDDELAAAVAHELAHNILRHRARLDAAGVDRGLGKQFGQSARLFKQTEVEADRLSVWLLAGAGYDPQAAVRFWTRFGQREGKPLFQAGTHPRWQDRVASFVREIQAIDNARAAGQPLTPPLIAAPPPLE